MMKKFLLLVLVLAMSITLAACGSDGSPGNQQTNNQQQVNKEIENNPVSTNTSSVAYGDIKLTPMDAYDVYMDRHPGTKVKKVQLDGDDGLYVYKIEGYDQEYEYEIKISPGDRKILEDETEKDDDNDRDYEIAKSDLTKVTSLVQQALQDAGEQGVLDEWEVEYEDGRLILELEIDLDGKGDIEYKYDLKTGELIKKDD